MFALNSGQFEDKLVQQVLERFKKEQDIYKQTRNRVSITKGSSLYKFLPEDTRRENNKGPFAPYLTNDAFIRDCLQFQFTSNQKDVVWHDIRVSHGYFRHHLYKGASRCCNEA